MFFQIEMIGNTKRDLSMCRVRDRHADCDLDPHQGHEDVASNLHEITSTSELRLIRELCDRFAYNTSEGTDENAIDDKSLAPGVVNAVTHYQILMEKLGSTVNG
jgi:hypothetical protein